MATQAERKATTRHALLDAAAERLVVDGLGGFTTAAVTAEAGVSNGALFGHFATRLDLLAATLDHVLARLRDDYDETFGGLDDTTLEPETALELLWSAMSDPQFCALLEIYTHARTDTDVLGAIHPIVAEHGAYVRDLVGRVAAAIAVDAGDVPRLVALGNAAILAMQGLAVGQMAGASPGVERDLIAGFAALVRQRDQMTSTDNPTNTDRTNTEWSDR